MSSDLWTLNTTEKKEDSFNQATDFVLELIAEPKHDLEIHLLWKQSFNIYQRTLKDANMTINPNIQEKNEFMKKDFEKLYKKIKSVV